MSPELLAQLQAVAALPDDQINTSDIPEVRDWSGAVRGKFFSPLRTRLTLEIDADVVDYFREVSPQGQPEEAMSRALRASMLRGRRRRRNRSIGESRQQERAKG